MNSLKLWLTLRVHGRKSYEDLIAQQMRLARLLEKKLLTSGLFKLTSPGPLPILNLVLKAPSAQRSELHRALVTEVTEDGTHWISTTRVQGESVVRMMVISYLTDETHIASLAGRVIAAAKSVLDRRSVGV
jgi:glutamate/tyrosine decarboxylase-like PLP-dependent enzyme